MQRLADPDLRHCPLCGQTWLEDIKPLGTLETQRGIGPRQYDLVACQRCQLIYLSPLPAKAVFDDLYIVNTQFLGSPTYTGEQAKLVLAWYVERTRALLGRIPSAGGLRVLEVGAGMSWMCHAAKIINPAAVTVAQDITPETLNVCSWVDHFFIGELEERLADIQRLAPFQIISLTHVIEHLPSPIATLRLLKPLLDEQGILFVTAPYRPVEWERDSSIENWRGWAYNHVPAHLQYFNERSLNLCAQRSGLAVSIYDPTADNHQAFEAWLVHPSRAGKAA
ncbi:MAG: class I SAM-dependent methyltransferase [Gemmataceae bacterium]|nr:class I SAM-dependent methyltransferase [Gemmataceae bacterium]